MVAYEGEVQTCLEIYHFLYSRIEESSEQCMETQGHLFGQCCEVSDNQQSEEDVAGNAPPPSAPSQTTQKPVPEFDTWYAGSLESDASTRMISMFSHCYS